VVALLVAGCATLKLGNRDLDNLDQLSLSLGEANSTPEDAVGLFIEGVGQLDLGHSGGCRSELQSFGHLLSGQRGAQAQAIWTDCGFTCPRDLTALINAPPIDRVALLQRECGPDPFFSDPTAADASTYLVLRNLLQQVKAELDREGTPRAQQSWEHVRSLLPRLQQGLGKP
jgi:hypothetical protein